MHWNIPIRFIGKVENIFHNNAIGNILNHQRTFKKRVNLFVYEVTDDSLQISGEY